MFHELIVNELFRYILLRTNRYLISWHKNSIWNYYINLCVLQMIIFSAKYGDTNTDWSSNLFLENKANFRLIFIRK